MKKICITLLLVITGILTYAQNLVWAKQMGGTADDDGWAVTVDDSGNVYTTGFFKGTADFDPGAGTYNLSAVLNADIFVSKLDASGNFVWAKQFGDVGNDYGESIKVDASGNVYTTGQFSGTVDFDPGPGTYNLTSLGGCDIFISKLDASGNFVWAKQMSGADDALGLSLEIDGSGNVYTTGYFYGTRDFDPGAGTYNLTAIGNADIFISKLDAGGNFVWAKQMSGTSDEYGWSITTDILKNVYVTGYFKGTVDFDPGAGTHNLTTAGDNDIFISKLDSNGNFIWANKVGGATADESWTITVDAFGNAIIAGRYTSPTLVFGGTTLTKSGAWDIFITKYDTNGNVLWAKSIGDSYDDRAFSVTTDASGNVYTAGWFQWSPDFDPGAGSFILGSAGSDDGFVSKLDSAGNFVWAMQIGGTGSDGVSAIKVDDASKVFVAGHFNGTVDFDPGAGTYNQISAGIGDIFVANYCQTPVISIAPSVPTICSGSSIILTASGADTYNWAPGTGLSSTTGAIVTANPTTTTTYTITGTAGTCVGTPVTITVIVNTVPSTPTAGSNSPLCVGNTLNLTASTIAGATYSWTGPNGFSSTSQNPIIAGVTLAAAGNYYVTATENGCTSTAGTATIIVNTTPSTPTAGNNGPVCLGSLLTLSASTIAGATYSWTGPNGFTSSSQNPTVSSNATAAMAGTYSVSATVGGCTSPAGTTTAVISNGQSFVWAKGLGGSSGDIGQFIARDALGNIYTTGYFHGTADFDPGAGTSNLISAGGVDVFISKLDPSGSYIWAKNFGGTGNDYGFSDAVDAFGNVYSTGQFQGTVDFDPNAGTYNLTSTGVSGTYISKLDASGNFKWAKQLSGTNDNEGISITTDASGSVYTTGIFTGTTDFDPNAGTFNLTSAGSFDVFISKLDSSGNFIWAKKIGGTLSDHGYSIKVGTSGNIYITGRFQNTVDFDPGAGTYNLTSAGAGDVFVLKLNSNGGFIWAKQFSGVLDDYAYSNAVDDKENVYTTGYFGGTVDFDPGAGTCNLTSTGNKDIFVSKLDSSGNFIWAKKMGGTADESGWSIAIDDSHNVYTTGYFQGTADFDPGPSTNNFTCAGVQDVFISKLDSLGNFVWAKQIGGASNDMGRCIDLDASGNIYITGDFVGTVDFDPEAGTYNLTSAGSDEVFVAKYHQPDFMQIVITPHNANCNQANGWAQATVNGGTLPYHYLWSNGDTTAIADTLTGGSYSLLVTDGCGNSKLEYFVINNSGGFTISGTTQDVHCGGGSDGAIDLTITGGTGPFTVNWSNGDSTQDISGLVAGTYDVNVTDALGCVGFASFTIQDGIIMTFTIVHTDPGCGQNNGSISITVIGGVLPYNYQWSSGQIAPNLSGIGAGNYIVTITDANLCSLIGTVSLNSSGAPVIAIDSVHSAPCGGSGAAYITITGGALPLTYHWSNSFAGEDIVGVVPGNYTVTVTDFGSCIAVAQVTIPTEVLPVQPICMVTVDSLFSRNKIVWSKVSSSGVDYYKIYRESSTPGQYLFVDTVRNTSMSKFTDMAANPMTRSWRYKISQVDLCGNESILSDLHKTMHLTINHGMGNQFNLIWDDYEGYYYPMFYVMRHTNALGWKTLDSLPNTLHSYTDDPPSMGGLKYMVLIKKADSCIAGISKDQTETYNTSVSNMEEYQILGVADYENNMNELFIYPNPAKESLTVLTYDKVVIEIINLQGQVVKRTNCHGKANIDISGFASGMYFIKAKTDKGIVVKKFVKE